MYIKYKFGATYGHNLTNALKLVVLSIPFAPTRDELFSSSYSAHSILRTLYLERQLATIRPNGMPATKKSSVKNSFNWIYVSAIKML